MMKKRRECLDWDTLHRRYHRSTRQKKSQLLDELEDLYGYNRKYLLQVFNRLTGRNYNKRGRRPCYDPKYLLVPLQRIWLATDQMCSKRLSAAMPEWLPFYDEMYEPLSKTHKEQMLRMSPATIDRILKPSKAKHKRYGLTGTKPGSLLRNQIPIKTDHWDVKKPGFLEADTVALCGNSIAGDFVWTVTLTDINTAWTEIRAAWNKGAEGIVNCIKDAENAAPFEFLGFDSDNGGEFINYHLIRYFVESRKEPVQLTRSRPYRKNDNAHVEQKNWTHVRHLFGYDRFNDSRAVPLMNDLCANEWSLYQNHFMPSMKLVEKEKINSKYRRKYDKPKTPYQRILESPHIPKEKKEELKKIHKQLNPFALKQTIEKKLRHIFKYVKVNPKPRSKI